MHAQSALLYEDCASSLNRNGAASLETLRGRTLFVTGGTGFIGSWLATFCAYLNDTYNFGVEFVSVARRQRRIEDRAPHLGGRRDIRYLLSDVRYLTEVPRNSTWVIHAAASPDAREHASNPVETMDIIAAGTYRVLRAVEQCNLRMMLYLSSALVYGAQPADLDALPEDFVGKVDTTKLTSAYAEAKRYAETLCASGRSQSRTPLIVVRPFTFLGPFQSLDAPWAMSNFLYAALNGQPLKILGTGKTRRSYLYGSDAAFLLLRILCKGESGSTFNLGHPEGVSLSDVAALVVQHASRPLEVSVNTARGLAVESHLIPDMSRAMKSFDFVPSISLNDAIKRTLSWYRAVT